LSESYGIELKTCEQGFVAQNAVLNSFSQHEEVVLWFEHDLFCQVNLLYLLDWFAQRDLKQTKLSLINVCQFPGRKNFRGLGELNARQLASLFPERHRVTAGELGLATSAWAAYCSQDPSVVEVLLRTDTSALPFLEKALLAHLKRFPATMNGLGQVENASLRLIDCGLERFIDLFPKFAAAEPLYGLGDAQLWLALRSLSDAQQPLLTVENGNGASDQLTPELTHRARFELTDSGRAVLSGEADFIVLNGIDRWLGGVHLQRQQGLWRWNEGSGRLELS
jgi:hypothetical protein